DTRTAPVKEIPWRTSSLPPTASQMVPTKAAPPPQRAATPDTSRAEMQAIWETTALSMEVVPYSVSKFSLSLRGVSTASVVVPVVASATVFGAGGSSVLLSAMVFRWLSLGTEEI